MTNTCAAPGCKSGYKPKKKKKDDIATTGNENENTIEKISLFSFPSDPEKRAIWVSKVPRQNWKTQTLVVNVKEIVTV